MREEGAGLLSWGPLPPAGPGGPPPPREEDFLYIACAAPLKRKQKLNNYIEFLGFLFRNSINIGFPFPFRGCPAGNVRGEGGGGLAPSPSHGGGARPPPVGCPGATICAGPLGPFWVTVRSLEDSVCCVRA